MARVVEGQNGHGGYQSLDSTDGRAGWGFRWRRPTRRWQRRPLLSLRLLSVMKPPPQLKPHSGESLVSPFVNSNCFLGKSACARCTSKSVLAFVLARVCALLELRWCHLHIFFLFFISFIFLLLYIIHAFEHDHLWIVFMIMLFFFGLSCS